MGKMRFIACVLAEVLSSMQSAELSVLLPVLLQSAQLFVLRFSNAS